MNGERFDTSCIIPTYKSGYKLLNVWSCFSYHGKLHYSALKEVARTKGIWKFVSLLYYHGQPSSTATCEILSYKKKTVVHIEL